MTDRNNEKAPLGMKGRFVEMECGSSDDEAKDDIYAGLLAGDSNQQGSDETQKYTDLPREYKLLCKLGEGAFSVVYKAEHKVTKRVVAVKIIDKLKLSYDQLSNVNNEINVMKRLRHSNVLRLLNLYNNEKYCYIVLQYCDGGEVFNKIIEYTYFSESLSRHVFTQLLSAVQYLHSVNVAHRDIKPENLLFNSIPYQPRSPSEFEKAKRLSDDASKVDEGVFTEGVGGGTIGVVKLADFGLAKLLKSDNMSSSSIKTPCGTAGYTAPEVITCSKGSKVKVFSDQASQNNFYTKSVDIWSLGCFLYTVLCGFPPFYDDDPHRLTSKIISGDYVFLKPWWDEISNEAKDLVSRMLQTNPEQRITVEEIWHHPWLKPNTAHKPEPSSYFTVEDAEHIEYVDYSNVEDDSDDLLSLTLTTGYSSDSTRRLDDNTLKDSPDFSYDHLPKGSFGPMTPRAGAIKMVFNNPAMSGVTLDKLNNLPNLKKNASSVKFTVENKHISALDKKSALPKTPLPTAEKFPELNFKNVFDINPSDCLHNSIAPKDKNSIAESSESTPEDLALGHIIGGCKNLKMDSNLSSDTSKNGHVTEAQYCSQDLYDKEYQEELADNLGNLDEVTANVQESQRSSINSELSDDLNFLKDENIEDYRTRSSSIISGINGDYKFTLSLNDSSLLRRRSSTNRSVRYVVAE